ncbi:hypothetical protein [Variovorax sp. UC74_104]|nr:hypothetical protein [Variovorax sp. SG517]
MVFYFGPLSKNELTIDFDEKGAAALHSKLSELLSGAKNVEHVNCLQSFRGHSEEAVIEVRFSVFDRLEIKRNYLLLDMSPDALEYAVHQLRDFLGRGYFFPSEFWSFSRAGRKYDTQVFFGKLPSVG